MMTKITMKTNTCSFPIVLEAGGHHYLERNRNGLSLEFDPQRISVCKNAKDMFELTNIRVSRFCDVDIMVGFDEVESMDRIIPFKEILKVYANRCDFLKPQRWKLYLKG